MTQQQPVVSTHSQHCLSVLVSHGEEAAKTAPALETESMIPHTYGRTCGFVPFKLYALSRLPRSVPITLYQCCLVTKCHLFYTTCTTLRSVTHPDTCQIPLRMTAADSKYVRMIIISSCQLCVCSELNCSHAICMYYVSSL